MIVELLVIEKRTEIGLYGDDGYDIERIVVVSLADDVNGGKLTILVDNDAAFDALEVGTSYEVAIG